jgi:hypothetical protein
MGMAIDWNDLVEKVGDQLDGENELLVKKVTTADGMVKEMRDFSELASLQTIARNQAAMNDKETNGLASLIEMDPI